VAERLRAPQHALPRDRVAPGEIGVAPALAQGEARHHRVAGDAAHRSDRPAGIAAAPAPDRRRRPDPAPRAVTVRR
jgi:hypothetical protein